MRGGARCQILADRCLLVKGSASVILESGRAHVFLAEIKPGERLIVPEGRRIPIQVVSESVFKILTGSSGSVEEIGKSPIPESWFDALSAIDSTPDHTQRILIVGGVDSGKNSLSTLLVNRLLHMIPRVSILDLDVGQSEVGLPATIALGTATHPVKSLCETEPQALCFVGSITPAPVTEKILTGVQKLLALTGRREGPLVVNTDGWVEGDGALQYKVRLADAVRPDVTILMGENDKTRRLIEEAAQRSRILKVEKPSFAYTRSREERKRLREQAYYRHLKGGTVKEFLLSKVRWSCSDAEKIPRQNVNLLVGLLGKTGLLQELGVLKSADPSSGKAWIYCAICPEVESIQVGMVRVREDGRELEPVTLWSERSAHQGD